ncbi:carbohydrate-binding module family 5 protein [Paxillus rubicundulus Ve08.2h10]|uniref:Carbohydrate-binding module family 5 protein n=1 Tax=Paxillus rubicundulus Ve08.2h10 TaxID=930991 RepID=A0A0D0DFY1_9AGAM|nr:carbohydrate-binding module family 5 protein [Paxillus rubicundulus Ve08.2h10]
MIPSTFFAVAVAFSSFSAANAVALRRDSAVTDLTPTDTATYTPTPSYTPTTCYSATPYAEPTYYPSSSPTYEIPPTKTSYESYSEISPTVAKRATVTCDGYQLWQANLAYSAGNKVIFNGKLYTANQWTYNNSPGTNPGQWTVEGDCAQPVNNKANCNGVTAWQQSKAYTAGNQVVYVNHLWVANQWTQSNTPGDFSGTWRDAGVCA